MTARKLQLASDLTLPLDVITESVGILAVKRAGKSYTAKRLAEQLLHAQQQVVVVDPKGDWWGLRSSADGQGPGFPIVILGGEHGDVPLEPSGGELVAQMVVRERVSVILDLSELRKHQVATFMTAFLETLYRLKAKEAFRTPLMLIIDEADAIASQKPQKGEERMLGAAEDIVRRGGQRGIGVMLVTQRAAVLNKNVLTQVGILILLRTTGSQDIDAIDEWIKKHSQETSRALVMESIAALPRGTAWVWAPGWPDEHGIFQRIKVLACETFNSGATPKVGERRALPKTLADVDLDAFRREMAATIEKAKADDPTELRRKIAGLERDLAAERRRTPAPVQTSAPTSTNIVELRQVQAEARQLQAYTDRLTQALERLMKFILEVTAQDFFKAGGETLDPAAMQKAIDGAAQQLVKLVEQDLRGRRTAFERWRKEGEQLLAQISRLVKQDVKISVAVKHNEPFTVTPAAPAPRPRTAGDGSLSKAQQAILDAAAFLESVGVPTPDPVQLALFAGQSASGGYWRANVGRVRTLGFLDGTQLTVAGRAQAQSSSITTVDELHAHVFTNLLGKAERQILHVLIAIYPERLSAEEVGRRAGIATAGGYWRACVGRLRSLGLITKQGELGALPVLFLEGAA